MAKKKPFSLFFFFASRVYFDCLSNSSFLRSRFFLLSLLRFACIFDCLSDNSLLRSRFFCSLFLAFVSFLDLDVCFLRRLHPPFSPVHQYLATCFFLSRLGNLDTLQLFCLPSLFSLQPTLSL